MEELGRSNLLMKNMEIESGKLRIHKDFLYTVMGKLVGTRLKMGCMLDEYIYI